MDDGGSGRSHKLDTGNPKSWGTKSVPPVMDESCLTNGINPYIMSRRVFPLRVLGSCSVLQARLEPVSSCRLEESFYGLASVSYASPLPGTVRDRLVIARDSLRIMPV